MKSRHLRSQRLVSRARIASSCLEPSPLSSGGRRHEGADVQFGPLTLSSEDGGRGDRATKPDRSKFASASQLRVAEVGTSSRNRNGFFAVPQSQLGNLAVFGFVLVVAAQMAGARVATADEAPPRVYSNQLKRLESPAPLLNDYPDYVAPVNDLTRYEAPLLVDDPKANLSVRAWRWSYNARGIIEMPNRLDSNVTAVIMVHPWGIDDSQGWRTPEPAGCADFCTPAKNAIGGKHTKEVIAPFLDRLRGEVDCVIYSLPGKEDAIRRKLYRSVRTKPTKQEIEIGRRELHEKLNSFKYAGQPVPEKLTLSSNHPVIDYFQQFPGLDAGPKFNNAGFWDLPIPVTSDLKVHTDDIVIYDGEGYPVLRDFLKERGVRHVLLTGYATDMCFCRTTAGFENLSRDFNVFLVGDATLATFPANAKPNHATNAAISFASLNQLITQVSWVKHDNAAK